MPPLNEVAIVNFEGALRPPHSHFVEIASAIDLLCHRFAEEFSD